MPTRATRALQQTSNREARKAIREINQVVRHNPSTFGWFEDNQGVLLDIVFQGYAATRRAGVEYMYETADAASEFVTPYPGVFSEAAVWASLKATGPAYVGELLAKGVTLASAREKMIESLDGAIYRHVYNGNRDTVLNSSRRNKTITAYRRVSTTGTPCAFCALMISRGPVYKSQRTAEGFRSSFRYVGKGYHDWDKCAAEPLYRGKTYPPTQQEETFNNLYLNSGGTIRGFREQYADYLKNNPGG